MPYIKPDRRAQLDARIQDLVNSIMLLGDEDQTLSDGDLNYAITKLLCKVLRLDTGTTKYHKINTAVGVLECVKQELYRRVAVPYEKDKMTENGDVF